MSIEKVKAAYRQKVARDCDASKDASRRSRTEPQKGDEKARAAIRDVVLPRLADIRAAIGGAFEYEPMCDVSGNHTVGAKFHVGGGLEHRIEIVEGRVTASAVVPHSLDDEIADPVITFPSINNAADLTRDKVDDFVEIAINAA